MSTSRLKSAVRQSPHWLSLIAIMMTTCLIGCAIGSFSTSGSPPSTPPAPLPANPPSLPKLVAATAVNDYVGTQIPGPNLAASENTVALHLDATKSTYTFKDIRVTGSTPNPVPDSSGLSATWFGFSELADTTGVAGLPGAQQYGLSLEEPSRFGFFISSSAQQIAPLVPKQTSGCVTPSTMAVYQYITLFGSGFLPDTDSAYGTLQLSASGNSFQFANALQYTAASKAASTGLIPLATGTCAQSAASPDLGYFIDTPASAANGNTELRFFLGPTGMLLGNQQGKDGGGNPLPLPGILAMVQPSTALDIAQLTENTVWYRALQYQPGNPYPAQYGYFGQNSSFLSGTQIVDSSGLNGGWQNPGNPVASPVSYSTSFVFGAPDTGNPGLFSKAEFVYLVTGAVCPAGTQVYSNGPVSAGLVLCSSHAVAMVGQQNGKYVIFVTGLYEESNNAPTLVILVQD